MIRPRSTPRLLAVLGAGSALVAAGLAMPSLAQASTGTAGGGSVDCTVDSGTYTIYVAPGASATIGQTNCTVSATGTSTPPLPDAATGTPTASAADDPALPASFTVAAGTSLTLGTDADPGLITIDVIAATPVGDPTGVLISSNDVTIGASPREFTIDQDEETQTSGFTPEFGAHVYQTIDFDVTQTGDFTLRVSGTSPVSQDINELAPFVPIGDTTVGLYNGSFDPSDPTLNAVTGNDDRSQNNADGTPSSDPTGQTQSFSDGSVASEVFSELHLTALPVGHYSLVLTTFESISAAQWAAGTTADEDTFAPGSESASIQFYGAADSLVITPAPTLTAPAAALTVGTPYSAPLEANAALTTFAVTSGTLPTGLALDPATGVISGTPTTAGTFTYTVSATNGSGTTTATYTQTVTDPAAVTTGAGTTVPVGVHLPVVSG